MISIFRTRTDHAAPGRPAAGAQCRAGSARHRRRSRLVRLRGHRARLRDVLTRGIYQPATRARASRVPQSCRRLPLAHRLTGRGLADWTSAGQSAHGARGVKPHVQDCSAPVWWMNVPRLCTVGARPSSAAAEWWRWIFVSMDGRQALVKQLGCRPPIASALITPSCWRRIREPLLPEVRASAGGEMLRAPHSRRRPAGREIGGRRQALPAARRMGGGGFPAAIHDLQAGQR